MTIKDLLNPGEIIKNVEYDVYRSFYVLHPIYCTDKKVDWQKLSGTNNKLVLSLDRNVLGKLLSAVKSGSFDGKYRKPTTALLLFAFFNGLEICPFDALKEQAYIKNDNRSAKKEDNLFNYLFDSIGIQTVYESYCKEGIRFTKKTYQEVSEDGGINYVKDNADFLFLYASMLHFVYVLKTESQKDRQLEKYMDWYFNNMLISEYVLTYVILYFTSLGITPPHNMNVNSLIIDGCKNQAMDLYYLQEIDPRSTRIPQGYTFMVVTEDNVLSEISERHRQAFVNAKTVEDIFNSLCQDAGKKAKDYSKKLLNLFESRKRLNVNSTNALETAQKLAHEEEINLRASLKI